MSRITANKHVMHWNGETVTITRRFLKSGSVRVRVVVTASFEGTERLNEFRDYVDMHKGDAVYARHVNQFERNIMALARKAWNAK